MLKEFKQFIARGNIVEIAVGIVMAIAFKPVIDTLVEAVLTPLIAALVGQPDFSQLRIDLWNEAAIGYGVVLNAVFSFLSVAAAVFFFVVRPYNALKERMSAAEAAGDDEAPAPSEEIVLLREIRDALRA